jgi:hypothetical protein
MANPQPLCVSPLYDLIWDAGLVMTNQDPDYPVGNAQGISAETVAKSTTTTTTVTITTPSAVPLYFAVINTNAETITFNGNAVTVPAVEQDFQRVHPRRDLRPLSLSAGTSWSVVLSRSSGVVWFSRLSLATAVIEVNAKYGWSYGRMRPGDVEIRTRLGSMIRHSAEIRTRWAEGVVDLIEDAATLAALESAAMGKQLPFLFIPDENTNDAWWVRLHAPDFRTSIPNYDVREIPLRFEELSTGPRNG